MSDDYPREVTMEIDDPDVWDRLTTGRLTGFSVAPSDSVEVNWDELQIQQDVAVHDYMEQAAESFAEYVVAEAGHTLTVDSFGVDAVRECVFTLYNAGFKISDRVDDGGELGYGFAAPLAFNDLKAEWCEHARLWDRDGPEDVDGPKQVGVDGVEVWADASMPGRTAVVLHPDAVAPNPLREVGPPSGLLDAALDMRPWVVRHPDAVVAVEVTE